MLYKGLNIGVFYKDKSWAEKWFNDFVEKIDHVCILRFVKNGIHPFMIELLDGTQITAYNVNDAIGKILIDKAFVEPTIGDRIIDKAIKPLISNTSFVEVEY